MAISTAPIVPGAETGTEFGWSNVWELLSIDKRLLERIDLARVNLAVARGVACLRGLDADSYILRVDRWTERFQSWLCGAERQFLRTPDKWKNDVRFFRVGMLQGFLTHVIGLTYLEDRRKNTGIPKYYVNPSELFLNGLIDTKQGTCASMPTLHVAISRRLGWPVSLACVGSHHVSRFDDGEVSYNIESTSGKAGSFSSGTDEMYLQRFNLPRMAIECGSDLRKLTMREMIGLFVGFRGRHYFDIGREDLADVEFSLARALFPNHRGMYLRAITPYLHRGKSLFGPGEAGHSGGARVSQDQ